MIHVLLIAFALMATLIATVTPSTAHAQIPDSETLEMTKYVIGQTQKKMKGQRPANFDATDASQPPVACVDAYRNLYAKPEVKLSVTLGYWENMATPQDQIRRDEWARRLQRPCPKISAGAAACDNSPGKIAQEEPGCARAAGTCGFEHPNCTDKRAYKCEAGDDDNLNLFVKTTTRPDGKPHTIRLSLVSSSASSDDKQNRAQMAAGGAQARKTAEAETNFFGGLENADAVIYVGHARCGGGPSFGPPDLNRDGITPACTKYGREEKSEKRMTDALARATAAGHAPKFLGIFACSSGPHFAAGLRTNAPNSGLATTDKLTENEVGFSEAYGALDSLLAMRCENEFKESINAFKYFGDDCADPLHSNERLTHSALAPGVTPCVKAATATLENFFKGAPAPSLEVTSSALYRTPGTIADPPRTMHPRPSGEEPIRYRTPSDVKRAN